MPVPESLPTELDHCMTAMHTTFSGSAARSRMGQGDGNRHIPPPPGPAPHTTGTAIFQNPGAGVAYRPLLGGGWGQKKTFVYLKLASNFRPLQ